MLGFRGKLGIIYPAPGFVAEQEFFSAVPEGVTVCTTRIPLAQTTTRGLEEMLGHACDAARLLAQAKVDIIGFLCTSGTAVKGKEFDKELASQIAACTGINTITTATAVVNALNALKATKLCVATPYSGEVYELERVFLEQNGFQVLTINGLGITDPYQMGLLSSNDIYELCRGVFRPDADALFISCTGLPTFHLIRYLEEDFGKPIVTSNQASLWCMLRSISIGAHIPHLGVLFEVR